MKRLSSNIAAAMGDFRIDGMMMRYSIFMPRLFNYCLSLGMKPGHIMPSRAFCSDENQGYPVILIAKHFGTFPFNHGRVGGIVATDRHGPHAHHGEDMVIIQASHVGYDPESGEFGTYRRLQTDGQQPTATCGKICHTIDWYVKEYRFARDNIRLRKNGDQHLLVIDNQLLSPQREQGLFLNMDVLVGEDARPIQALSTAKVFHANNDLRARVPAERWNGDQQIGDALTPETFFYRHDITETEEGARHLESNLLRYMPYIVTAKSPALLAAQVNSQVEFDRVFRGIGCHSEYRGKRVLFISGINIDVSPRGEQIFPLTKFVPWAAYIQEPDGSHRTLEQEEIHAALSRQSTENPHQIELDAAIQVMGEAEEVILKVDN